MYLRTLVPAAFCALIAIACGPSGHGNDPDPSPSPQTSATATPTPEPATRFTDEALRWTVPDSQTAGGFYSPSITGSAHHWFMRDLDGDMLADLVQTGDPAFGYEIWDSAGAPYWVVFRGDGTGAFDKNGMQWPVPDSGTTGGFHEFSSDASTERWQTIDMDGDGLLDLVQTGDNTFNASVWDASGDAYWKVWLNLGDGFDTAPIQWDVPDSGTTGGFYRTASAYDWATIDLNGDQRPDLVQMTDPTIVSAAVWDESGDAYWKVFLNNGLGFDLVATQWTIPDSGTAGGFYELALDSATRHWTTMDIDGDGLADLVQTSDPTVSNMVWDESGDPYWAVYANTGAGFDRTPDAWPVPDSKTTGGFHSALMSFEYRNWTLRDIDGDGLRDLVQTGDATMVNRVWDASGFPYWRVFLNDGSAFAGEALRWSVPESGNGQGFYTMSSFASYRHWTTADVNGDGALDLLHSGDVASANETWDSAGSPYWKVFLAIP